MEQVRQARNVAVFIFEQVEPLDFAGPFEVFISGSNRGQDFNVYTVAETEGPIQALGGLSINPAYTIHNCPDPDILVIPGGWGSRKEMNNETITSWIREVSNDVEMILSVCTGALILAKANLLDGLKVTTNRLAMKELREIIPASTEIIEDVRYVDNGKIVLSAGISAGMDAALYVVERLLGEDRAIQTANIMEYDWKKA
ncbi:transcriptional regulator GlxA family with amidase domain [Paenibacillus sp. JGP012]|uniref:DJ-1/PfpI family protein n=1 Tax=Paenibacillus sp. JGP012 TaxID=2735914 RepID=UPI001613204B|nr:DJ-1/PfpI family protein [Paenibacillus sp. JGP012]MBB6019073.1 transcriptional regulator GlxA family with amidase domain [Paenibacillus sp. JGP012]